MVASSPRFARPMRLMMALSFGRRKTRGRGLPACGRGGHGPHLDESESQRGQFAERLAVVVESCGQPDGVGETDAEHLAFERRMLHGVAFAQQPAAAGYQPDDAQQQQHRVVGLLDGKREKYGLYDSPVHGF